jgi:hypothetical protein
VAAPEQAMAFVEWSTSPQAVPEQETAFVERSASPQVVPEQRMVFVEPVGQVLERTAFAAPVDALYPVPENPVVLPARTAPLAENLVETAQPDLLCPLERVNAGIVVQ